MEKAIRNFVNMAIGIVKTLQEEAERQYNDLTAAGESADDEISKKIKNSVDDALKAAQQYQDNITSTIDDLTAQVKEVLNKLNPSNVTEEIRAKLNELSTMANDLVHKAKPDNHNRTSQSDDTLRP